MQACAWDYKENDTPRRALRIEVAFDGGQKAALVEYRCSDCETLAADRLAFDVSKREMTFNLETDVKEIATEGGKLPIPEIIGRVEGRTATLAVPVFSVRFNEQWQVVQVTATAPPTLSGPELPAALSEQKP